MIDERIIVCALCSLLLHFVISRGLDELPPHSNRAPQQIDVRLVEPEPPPEPEKPPEPKPEPKPIPHEAPKPRAIKQPQAEQPKDTPPPTNAPLTNDTSDTPFYGGDINSTSTVGTGPPIPIGNTTRAPDAPSGSGAKPLPAPVAAYETTKMPIMDERCRFGLGKYTDEALQAAVEGQVVIDLIVSEDGSVREVQVVKSLPHGLTEEAVRALRACKFTPGEKDGHAVPVRIRGFKVTFVLPQSQ